MVAYLRAPPVLKASAALSDTRFELSELPNSPALSNMCEGM